MRSVLQIALGLVLSTAAFGVETDGFLASPDFETIPNGMDRPMGVLGFPLGTFAVVEGAERATGKLSGSGDFVVDRVNGKKLGHEVSIETAWSSQFPTRRVTGHRYVLHGYEGGSWGGTPLDLPRGEPGMTQSAVFFFVPRLVVTSIEKMDGVTVADARPLDDRTHLQEPRNLSAPAPGISRPPVGWLGLPLGTFAIIEVRKSQHPMMRPRPYELVRVNGVAVDPPRQISILDPDFTGDEPSILRGYETGEWGSEPVLPKSENPNSDRVQIGFQFEDHFVVTSRGK